MKKIKVKYTDWWSGFVPENYRIHQILSKNFEIEFSEDPDYVISSVYSRDFLKYDCVRILYTGENICPDFNLFDYAIGFEQLSFGDRYLRYPNYLMNPAYEQDVKRMLQKHLISKEQVDTKKEFCSFVYSNGNADPIRETAFYKLNEYRPVNSGGRFLNNIGLPEGVPDKYEFQIKHKFSIAFENSSHAGYTTEKLIQSFAAGTVPIYWGDPRVTSVFNPGAMIYVDDVQGLDKAVEYVKKIDMDDHLYLNMLQQPAVLDVQNMQGQYMHLEKFLTHIFSQPLYAAFRRNRANHLETYCNSRVHSSKKRNTFLQKIMNRNQRDAE